MERETLKVSFLKQEPILNEYASKLKSLISELVDPDSRNGFVVSARVKSATSFVDKALRKKYKDPFVETHDLVGIRIVVFFTDQVNEICTRLEDAFDVDLENSQDKGALLDVNQTGYQSTHKIVQIRPDRAVLPEWSRFTRIKAEIQVRTFLQHAWAQIEHALNYKSASNAPTSVIRRLYNLSALLEVTDGEFRRIRDEIKTTAAGYRAQVKEGNLDLEINLDSLREYLAHSSVFNNWELGETTPEPVVQAILEKVSELARLSSFQQIESLTKELLDIAGSHRISDSLFRWQTPGEVVLEALHLVHDTPELLNENLSQKTRLRLIQDYVDSCQAEYEDQLVSPWDD